MAMDYTAIREDTSRLERAVENSGKILTGLYEERTHFFFELLQNAEDALRRRGTWDGSRSVSFVLKGGALRVGHYGIPFDEGDVLGVCSIGEGTKDEDQTTIGRFGIGFKSVYAFTERPEVHSGGEAFAIEGYIQPVAVDPIDRNADETVIDLPLVDDSPAIHEELVAGMRRIGARSLLFLREIEEIRWDAGAGGKGMYLREERSEAPWVRRVTLLGEEDGKPDVSEEWLVFSAPVSHESEVDAGHVEIAYLVKPGDEDSTPAIEPETASTLAVFFPTVIETHMGVVLQGPYITTPSRDTVKAGPPWNRHLVDETAALLVKSLAWLRDARLLEVSALRCLPLDVDAFGASSRFRPIFDAVAEAMRTQELIPAHGDGHAAGERARLARAEELRALLSPSQLGTLLGSEGPIYWVSGDITPNRTPMLWKYLGGEVGVEQLQARTVVPRLDEAFLATQPDDWIESLYGFLAGQPALKESLRDIPLIRLENGDHVPVARDGQPQAFLPSGRSSGFPTVRRAVCKRPETRDFLSMLGLTEPHIVDDVVQHVLPHLVDESPIDDEEHAEAFARILAAFGTDSTAKRDQLIRAARGTPFVRAVNLGDGSVIMAPPANVYLATDRLKALFAGVEGVLIVDDSVPHQRGEAARELLLACGAGRHLAPIRTSVGPGADVRREARREAHFERFGWEGSIEDRTVRGLQRLLALLPELSHTDRAERARVLWDALAELAARRSTAFQVEYSWSYSHEHRTTRIDAAFVRRLNEAAWVPDETGELRLPGAIPFDSLGWKADPIVQARIRFRPSAIDELAEEAGLSADAIVLLKEKGITTIEDVRRLLGEDEDQPESRSDSIETPLDEREESRDEEHAGETVTGTSVSRSAESPRSSGQARQSGGQSSGGSDRASRRRRGTGTDGGGRTREFVSYVAVEHESHEDRDPDGLAHEARMALEESAIVKILEVEPAWHRTPPGNHGFDLVQRADDGTELLWCEVKAMSVTLEDRPAVISDTQFRHAQMRREAYWLYVVENAGTPQARIVRIQDPAGRAMSFMFDRGWLAVADLEVPGGDDGDASAD